MDPKIILVLFCIASVVAAAPSPLPLERATHEVARRAAYGDVLSNLVHRRSRRSAARFGRDFDAPQPCFGPRFQCPHPKLPALCRHLERADPCSGTQFLTVEI
ncbi:uncharacterized protein LOC143025452 [Oratosquilla oratoria]|uniref:uncharacterized protein LOC143025452 n=1 Tax=Oratosquilla oratoria TaxID=337810 RepID=UPI003F75A156